MAKEEAVVFNQFSDSRSSSVRDLYVFADVVASSVGSVLQMIDFAFVGLLIKMHTCTVGSWSFMEPNWAHQLFPQCYKTTSVDK